MNEAIKKLIQEARTKEALELLVTKVPDASVLLASFNDASKKYNLGIIDYREFSQKQSQVAYAALEFLRGMETNPNVAVPIAVSHEPSVRKIKKMFISYSKSDKSHLEEFKKQLSLFRRQELLETWDDSHIQPGEEWDKAIKRELASADIIVLLISADLINTDYIWDIEMKEAMERHDRGEATVIPVIIRPCMWETAPFGKLNALPEKGVPVEKWSDRDEAWTQVVMRIKQVL